MKVYFFFIDARKINTITLPVDKKKVLLFGKEYYLYAITKDKNLHKEFKKQRNMKYFKIDKVDVSEEIWKELYPYALSYKSFCDDNENDVVVLSTYQEWVYVTQIHADESLSKLNDYINESTLPIFKNKYIKALELTCITSISFIFDLQFDNILNSGVYCTFDEDGRMIIDETPYGHIKDISLKLKSLSIFISVFGYTLK